jgi:hypothetical protein
VHVLSPLAAIGIPYWRPERDTRPGSPELLHSACHAAFRDSHRRNALGGTGSEGISGNASGLLCPAKRAAWTNTNHTNPRMHALSLGGKVRQRRPSLSSPYEWGRRSRRGSWVSRADLAAEDVVDGVVNRDAELLLRDLARLGVRAEVGAERYG